MELAGFLGRPQHNTRVLKILSWNINGCKTKLEKKNVEDMLLKYDIVALNEVKTSLRVCLPGYVSYMSYNQNAAHRGGTTVMIKNCLSEDVIRVDTSMCDQVWFELSCVPGVMFGACYIPPSDSLYFSHESFAAIHEKLMENNCDKCLILGDVNARLGKAVRDIANNTEYAYPLIPDDVNTPNDNAYALASVCKDNNLIVINNLKTREKHFVSNLTFKKDSTWISELDVCIASEKLVRNIDLFQVHQTEHLPSDHAPIAVQLCLNKVNLDHVLRRAYHLGGHASLLGTAERAKMTSKPIKFNQINHDMFSNLISNVHVDGNDVTVDEFAEKVSEVLYECCSRSRGETAAGEGNDVHDRTYTDRWDRLLQDRDDSRVWRAIDWKGKYQGDCKEDGRPSDQEFKEFYEEVLNPTVADNLDDGNHLPVNIPILDDQISQEEVQKQIDNIKLDKACGPDGVSPGVLKLLTGQWLLIITTLFNTIFASASYPSLWSTAKLFMLFKRGNRREPRNYRGVTIINCLAKLFDMVLFARLERWFKPYREQAGAQKGRGCIEHIVTLRLLTDMAKRKKRKLFVMFVDFTQAYDLVPRSMLFAVLKRLGCGSVMLAALVAMYAVTNSVIGSVIVAATVGVRQGSSTSCLLFVLYVNDLIKIIKENSNPDGFLSWLHILVLMDDTVLLATTKDNLINKVTLLKQYCDSYGMKINATKTKFFVICGTEHDREAVRVDDLVVESCAQYTYLGSPFTADGSVSAAVAAHMQAKMAHFNKFVLFLKKNCDWPFIVKKRIFDAALMSAVLYGCESWLNADLKPATKIYNWALKQLLGVRKTTCNDMCYIESGYPPLKDLVRSRQRKFFTKVWRERSVMNDDPLMLVIHKVLDTRYTTRTYVHGLIFNNLDDIILTTESLKNDILRSESSRRMTYREINPGLSVHEVYRVRDSIPERERMSFTQFRLSAHSLAVETGRWNRRGRGRLPIEERLCPCGCIQTETHVVQDCPSTQHVRDSHDFVTIQDIFSEQYSNMDQCKIVHLILSSYN